MLTKKVVLYLSGIIAMGLVIIGTFGTYALCNSNELCINILHQLFLHFLPFGLVFLFSLITYWMREKVYQAWFRFARWWIPLSMLLILISPEYSGDWMYPIEKGSVALLTCTLFGIVSILIIAVKLLRPNR